MVLASAPLGLPREPEDLPEKKLLSDCGPKLLATLPRAGGASGDTEPELRLLSYMEES
eukprot:CAMPEP_0169332818 /NCGR_PEP_ID=MMETSP1017-20121227/14924_1 /TAXON_ID=342587 /ORGANISM="Karlodinium micrum, Strain CCMP2283" /LENGTH=57 /DNA_ID=CAMNT_0009427989 /DNA_START=268 /DNA_END=437 /DNA_ORIENTATION=-